MPENSHKDSSSKKKKQTIHKTILNDLRQGNIRRTFWQELQDIYYFYLDQQTRLRLGRMGSLRRWITVVIWLVKSMILKLTPFRRILLVISILLFIIGDAHQPADPQTNTPFDLYGYLLLFFILMLQLKDALLAKDELAMGRAVQRALIPSDNPTLSGWDIWLFTRPANDVGGDLVDYLNLSDDRIGITLGDVVGKGLGAALLMAKLQATMRALAPGYRSLSEFGARMNEIFVRDGLPSHFASMVYLELISDSGKVRLLNAGHFPPLKLSKQKLEEMDQGASALGVLPDEVFHEQQQDLAAGDVLVIYSDGLTEALDQKGRFYGEEKLKGSLLGVHGLSAEEIGQRLLADVEGFVGQARSSDDLSLVILRKL